MTGCGNDYDKQDITETMTKEVTVERTIKNPDPHSVEVMVNKDFPLPSDFEPQDLVYPDVRFIFEEKIEKRMMREEAAAALKEMFDSAELDGIYLAGVSAYRSHKVQTTIFNQYVQIDGEENAKKYSATPGTSEHETGLAIDVSGSNAKCAVEDCFADTDESAWLETHAAEYGFIIRYPAGKEEVTGFKYEPWHLRYVGKELAIELNKFGITLEEYYGKNG
ncbi:M15 family metallopeptidase [bacterium LRH843]|nr:M15 family metallopeptidase [bacterium LRH843]